MAHPLTIGIIGDFDSSLAAHTATNDALTHAAQSLGMDLDIEWLPTPTLEDDSDELNFKWFDGLWCAPGSPYRSMNGALNAIRFCRKNAWPFLGT